MYFEAETLDDLMVELFPVLLAQPASQAATRGKFSELIGPMLVITKARARVSRSDSRSKIFSALGELVWYLSKTNSHRFIEYYMSGMYQKEYENDDNSVRNGYGTQLFCQRGAFNQIQNVIHLLGKKPSSRRAVIQIFDANDLAVDFKEVPCTCTLQFLIRDGKLHLLANLRSSDAYRGLPHDVFVFTMLQELIARSLNVDIGDYKHCAGSLHLYKDDQPAAALFLKEGLQNPIEMPPMPAGDQWPAIEKVMSIEAKLRLDGSDEIEKSDLDPYWKDLCRLLSALRASKNLDGQYMKNLEHCQSLKKQLASPKAYGMFIDNRLDQLEAKMAKEVL